MRLVKYGKKAMAAFLAFCFVLGMLPVGAMAAGGRTDTVKNPDPEYQYALADGDNSAADKSNYDVKISKSAEATVEPDVFNIKLTVESKDRIVETEKVVGADIVLVFDLSNSMNGSNWTALKKAANRFIDGVLPANTLNQVSIVGYGQDVIDISKGWLGDAASAKGTYGGTEGSNITIGDLRGSDGGSTNCQAGFRAAGEQLSTGRKNALQYVVFMSDGEANKGYRKLTCNNHRPWHDHDDSCYSYVKTGGSLFGPGNGNNATCATYAQKQAADLKADYPGLKLYTVGFGTKDNNPVLDKDQNTAVDEDYNGNDDAALITIYDTISTQIKLETNPWTVLDNLSQYVEYVDGSLTGSENVTWNSTKTQFVWNVEKDAGGTGTKQFTISYQVRLKDSAVPSETWWGSNGQGDPIWRPTNGVTSLSYKVVRDGETYPTRTVDFEVPEVRADAAAVTLHHVIDGGAIPHDTETIRGIAGTVIDLDSHIKSYGTGITYTGRDAYSDASFTLGEPDGAVITYQYITGYQVTIHYYEKDTSNPVAPDYSQGHANGGYEITSPTVDGYRLVNTNDQTVSVTVNGGNVEEYVYYEKIPYTVGYRFEGPFPDGVNPPVDNEQYNLIDHNTATVKGVVEPGGWAFSGWTVEGGGTVYKAGDPLTITGDMTLVGTWAKTPYSLDIVYALDQTAYDAYQADKERAESAVEPDLAEVPDEWDDSMAASEETLDTEKAEYESNRQAVMESNAAAVAAADEANREKLEEFEAKWDIGAFVEESYTANNGIDYTTGGGVYYFYKQDPAEYHFDDVVQVDPVDPGTDYKVSPSAQTVSFATFRDQTAFFSISNDLFTVSVVHHYMRDGVETKEYDTPVSMHSGEGYTVSERIKGGYTPSAENAGKLNGVVGSKDVTIDLYYTADPYTVTFTFEGEDGHGVATPGDQTRYVDGYAADPGMESPAGWDFSGWYTKGDGGAAVPYDFNTPITGNLDLYGSWSRTPYTVTFHFTGDVPEGETVKLAGMSANPYYYNGTVEDPGYSYQNTDDSKVYSFDGWYQSASIGPESVKYDFASPITGNLDLYGKFTAKTATYGFVVDYYLDGVKQGRLDSVGSAPYHSEITTEAVESGYRTSALTALTEAGLSGSPYFSFEHAVGISSIGSDPEQNVAELYFTTDQFTATVHYWYYPLGTTTAVAVPASMLNGRENPTVESGLVHGQAYSIQSPDISHYYLKNSGDATVSDVIDGQNAVYDVYYLELGKFTATVKYFDLADKGKEETAAALAPDAPFRAYTDETLSIAEEYTSGKAITNYSYAETVGNTSGISGETTIYVYFTRDTYTLTVKHVDGTKQPGEDGYLIGSGSQTISTGEGGAAAPTADLPKDYKLISTTTDAPGNVTFDDSGKATVTSGGKDQAINITYTYGPKENAYVTVNYILTDGSRGEDGKYAVLGNLGQENLTVLEGAYDVTEKVYAFEAAHAMYTRIDNDVLAGSLAVGKSATVNVYYTANPYEFSVRYHNDYTGADIPLPEGMNVTAQAPYGTRLDEETVAGLLEHAGWVNALRPSGYREGTFEQITVSADKERNVIVVRYSYTPPTDPGGGDTSFFKVTVNYLELDTGKTLHTRYVSDRIREGANYNVTEEGSRAISGYTIDHVEGDLTGRMNGDVSITVWYAAESSIVEPEVPLGPNPDQPGTTTPDSGSSGDVTIGEPEVPKGDSPDAGSGDDIIIIDGGTPLGNLPQTGTEAQGVNPTATLGSLALAASLAAAGLAFVTGRKREEER